LSEDPRPGAGFFMDENLFRRVSMVSIQHFCRSGAKLLILAVSGENVGGTDAAAEPTWTYLRRFSEETANSSDTLIRC